MSQIFKNIKSKYTVNSSVIRKLKKIMLLYQKNDAKCTCPKCPLIIALFLFGFFGKQHFFIGNVLSYIV